MTDEYYDTMMQSAPYPEALAQLVEGVSYRPGWRFTLGEIDRGQGSKGLTLDITALVVDSRNPEQQMRVRHLFIVPAASYNRRSWQRWLLDRCIDVETHEACEFFCVDGERVYAPHHSEGEDPYTVFEISDAATAAKSFRDK